MQRYENNSNHPLRSLNDQAASTEVPDVRLPSRWMLQSSSQPLELRSCSIGSSLNDGERQEPQCADLPLPEFPLESYVLAQEPTKNAEPPRFEMYRDQQKGAVKLAPEIAPAKVVSPPPTPPAQQERYTQRSFIDAQAIWRVTHQNVNIISGHQSPDRIREMNAILQRVVSENRYGEVSRAFQDVCRLQNYGDGVDLHEYAANRIVDLYRDDDEERAMRTYTQIWYSQQAVADAENFYQRVSGPTLNRSLRNYILELAGYDENAQNPRPTTPDRLLAAARVYEECWGRLYDENQTFDYALRYELLDTTDGDYALVASVVQQCRNIVANRNRNSTSSPTK